MAGRYLIGWLVFFGAAGLLAWWFSNGNIVAGLLIFAFFAIPISLWARAKSKKFDPIKGTLK